MMQWQIIWNNRKRIFKPIIYSLILGLWLCWDIYQAHSNATGYKLFFNASDATISNTSTKVSIVRTNDVIPGCGVTDEEIPFEVIYGMVKKAVDDALLPDHLSNIINPGDVVLIKPNIVRPDSCRSGGVTDVRVVKALVYLIDSIYPGNIRFIVGDGSGAPYTTFEKASEPTTSLRWEDLFGMPGYQQLITDAKAHGIDSIRLSNLNGNSDENPRPEIDSVNLEHGYAQNLQKQGWYHVHEDVTHANVYINVPVLKMHPQEGFTCALKNQIGLAAGSYYGYNKTSSIHQDGHAHNLYHGSLFSKKYLRDCWQDKEVVDFSLIANINSKYKLTVVDALACLETRNHPIFQGGQNIANIINRIKMNTIIAGRDPVAVDNVCCRIMERNPDDIEHITLAERAGLGTNNPDNITVVSTATSSINAIKRMFKKSVERNMATFGQSNRIWLLSDAYSISGIADPMNHEFIPNESFASPTAGHEGWSRPIYFVRDQISLKDYYNEARQIDPVESLVSYAFTYFNAPAAQQAQLWIGSDEAVKVYLNGQVVYNFSGTREFDDTLNWVDIVSMPINQGLNSLLVKTYQGPGSTNKYTFSLNICEVQSDLYYRGNRIMGLKFLTNAPPLPPQNLSPTAGYTQVTLSWNKNTEGDVAKYRIYYGTTSPASALIDSTNGVTDTVYNATGLTNGTTYYFCVTAVDSAGLESEFSNEVAAIPVYVDNILRLAPYAQSGKYLNQQVAEDTIANGKLSNRAYVLQRGGIYRINSDISNYNWTLRIRANDSASTQKPVVMFYPSPTTGNLPNQFINARGDVELKNIMITGYSELSDTNLRSTTSYLLRISSTTTKWKMIVDSCILSNSRSMHLRVDVDVAVLRFTNTIFANMGYLGGGNLGLGRAIDLRDLSVDSLIIQNCTFVNLQDRIVRHLVVYNSLASGDPTGILGYFKFDHNTLVNSMSYHGMFSLGTMGSTAIITNNLLLNPFALGNDTDASRQAEFIPSGEKDAYGKNRMSWIINIPNGTTQWTISNNYYGISDSGQAFYDQYVSSGVKGEGSPLTWHINSRIGADSVNAFRKIRIKPIKVSNLMTNLMRWYRSPSGGNKTKNTPEHWVFGNPNVHPYADPYDFDRKDYHWLQDSLNCSYYANETPTSTDGKVVGDTRWNFIARIPVPAVISFTPTKSALYVVQSTNITITFSGDVNPATLTNSTIVVRGLQSGLHLSSNISYSSGTRTVTVNPNTDFMPGETAIITVTRGIKSPLGDSLLKAISWIFRIAPIGRGMILQPYAKIPVGNKPVSVVAADFDSDGDIDIAVANKLSNTITILKNNETKQLVESSTLNVTGNPVSISIADLDSDGDIDLSIVTETPQLYIFKNDGSGVFSLSSIVNLGGSGSGSHSPLSKLRGLSDESTDLSLISSDINGDGDVDLATANYSTSNVTVFSNDGIAAFTSIWSDSVGTSPHSIATADFDSDGDMDFVTANHGSNTLSFIENGGDDNFLVTSIPSVGEGLLDVIAVDVDRDGNVDIAVTDTANVIILKNDGNANFSQVSSVGVGSGAYSMETVDLDGDGNLDLAVGNAGSHTVTLLKNNGSGTFSQNSTIDVSSPYSITFADVDGDGDVDLITTNTDSNTVSILKNNYNSTQGHISVSNGWNLISVPLVQTNDSAEVVFPGKYGSMFGYNQVLGDYMEAPTLQLGFGYWVYYASNDTIAVNGIVADTVTISCKAGWHLIGSREREVQIADLQLSAGSIYGSAFYYDTSLGDYAETAVIKPGQGIWVYLTQDCELTIP